MAEDIYDTWGGLTFGENAGTEVYGLVESPGSYDLKFTGGTLTGTNSGVPHGPLWADARSWNTVLTVSSSTAAGWETKWKNLRSATSIASSFTTEAPYVIVRRNDTRTIYARVTGRSIPRNRDTEVVWDTRAIVQFAAIDPVIYGPTQTESFTGGSDSAALNNTGWATTHRWKWVVPGPVTNPQISSSIDSSAVIRFVGTVATGSNLVVERFPKGHAPGYIAKVVTDAQLASYATDGIGTAAYSNLDGGPSGSTRPPQWFGMEPGSQTISYSATSGTAGSDFTWRIGED